MAALWEITDHVCAVCFGRVLRRWNEELGEHVVRCADCGVERLGLGTLAERLICACGIRLAGGRDAKIRCRRQERPTPEFPSEVVAMEVK